MTSAETGWVLYVAVFVAMILYMIYVCSKKPEPERGSQDRRVVVLVAVQPAPAPVEQRPAPPPVTLPYFPYAQGREPERLVCAICLELLRHGELCSEVPACRHVFHKECIGVWTRSSNSCPLCRVIIVPGSRGVSAADGMV